jgi:HprK-related kinase B
MHRGQVLCHAAGVVHEGKGLAIAGVSGAGKSTLSLRLLTHGFSFTSNDRLLIGKTNRHGGGHRMGGVPKQPRINPGTALSIPEFTEVVPAERRAALLALPEDELWELEEKYDADVARLFGGDRFRLAAPLTAFLVLRWTRNAAAPTVFERVDLSARRDVLSAIMKPPGPFYEPGNGVPPRGAHRATEEDYLCALDGLPVYEATGKLDFEAAVAFSTSLLRRGGRPA